MPQGLPRRLRRVFVLQTVLAIVAVLVCLHVSTLLARGVLATQWMRVEAARFWTASAADPDYRPPSTSSVQGYFVPQGMQPAAAGVPRQYLDAAPGMHRLRSPGTAPQRLLVEDGPGGRLYLRITFRLLDTVGRSTLMIASLLAAFTIALMGWLGYRVAKRLVMPVHAMAGEVAKWNPGSVDLDAIEPARLPGDAGSEVRLLGGALRGLAERTQDFVRRERDFTREASHELRTPLTVVRVATDMLSRDPELPPRLLRSVNRVQVAALDMEVVVDALLILAREDVESEQEPFEVLPVAAGAVALGESLLAAADPEGPVGIALLEHAAPKLRGSSRALALVLEQLVRNACTFTSEGRVEVVVESDRVEIRDTGVGMAPDVLERAFEPFYRADQYVGGRGLGLPIVRRLAARYGWTVLIDSEPGKGTAVTLRFPASGAWAGGQPR